MNSARRSLLTAVCGVALLQSAFVSPATGQTPDANIYVVIHVDIAGTPAIVAEATRLLREFASESKKDTGVARFELLLQDGRLNHFTIMEVWRTRDAFEAHNAADHTKRFRQQIQPMLGSPFDERLHGLLP